MVKKILFIVLKIIVSIVGFVVLYLALSYLIPFIPVQAEATPEQKVVKGFIKTNGVHTDIVVPVKNVYYDWSRKFPFQNTLSKRSDYSYVGIGWGDKGFYLDTPTWADLKFSTAFKAAFWLGEAAVHTTFYTDIKENDSVKSFTMTQRQYENLIKYVDSSLDKDKNGRYINIKTKAVYGKDDAFYEAKGSYSFLHTCNTWANDGLKEAGQKAALWSPSDFGIFQHYK